MQRFCFFVSFLFTVVLAGLVGNGALVLAGDLPILNSKHKFLPAHAVSRSAAIDARKTGDLLTLAVTPTNPLQEKRLRRRLSAKSAFILDAKNNLPLFALNAQVPRQPASTIKILTGLIAIESLRDSALVRPSRRAAGMPRSKIWLDPKKTYRANDLINAVLLASANDASVALAETIAGSETRFAERMNRVASLLGARRTNCRSASGLTRRGQKSTARDLAVMFNAAMRNHEFARRIGRTKIRTSYGRTLWNHNKALWRIKGAVGGKTGYTNAARQTYVGKFRLDNQELVVAIMGSESMWNDISQLVHYGFKELERRQRYAPPVENRVASQLAMLKLDLVREYGAPQQTIPVLGDVKKVSRLAL